MKQRDTGAVRKISPKFRNLYPCRVNTVARKYTRMCTYLKNSKKTAHFRFIHLQYECKSNIFFLKAQHKYRLFRQKRGFFLQSLDWRVHGARDL